VRDSTSMDTSDGRQLKHTPRLQSTSSHVLVLFCKSVVACLYDTADIAMLYFDRSNCLVRSIALCECPICHEPTAVAYPKRRLRVAPYRSGTNCWTSSIDEAYSRSISIPKLLYSSDYNNDKRNTSYTKSSVRACGLIASLALNLIVRTHHIMKTLRPPMLLVKISRGIDDMPPTSLLHFIALCSRPI
jgi:hypothetical protein